MTLDDFKKGFTKNCIIPAGIVIRPPLPTFDYFSIGYKPNKSYFLVPQDDYMKITEELLEKFVKASINNEDRIDEYEIKRLV